MLQCNDSIRRWNNWLERSVFNLVYVTGDTHAEFNKFSTKRFPEQKELTKEDFVIVCGDFGVWHDCPEERYWFDWLSKKPFTLLFVDGNHENFERLKNQVS